MMGELLRSYVSMDVWWNTVTRAVIDESAADYTD